MAEQHVLCYGKKKTHPVKCRPLIKMLSPQIKTRKDASIMDHNTSFSVACGICRVERGCQPNGTDLRESNGYS